MKTCTKCLTDKPLSEFSRNNGGKASKSGLKARCKKCLSVEAKEWADKNRERVRLISNEWKAGNRDRVIASRIEYYKKHGEKERLLSRAWHADNKERSRAYARVYRALRLNADGSHTHEDIKRLNEVQRGLCAVCKVKMRKYHIDHIEPLSKGGSNWPSNLQLLCQPCNSSKGAKNPVDFMQQRGYLL